MELTYCGSECFLPLETLYLRAYRRRSGCRRTDAILLQLQNRIQWALNSAVECHPLTVEVVGSNPTAPTIFSWAHQQLNPQSQSNLRRGFKQFRKTIDVRGTRVANHEIAKPALTPCCHVERYFLRREKVVVQPSWQ